MMGDLLGQVWAELSAISKELVEPFTVVECDCTVQRVYEFSPTETPKFQGYGGTLYQPAIDEALKHSPDGIAFIGDMDAADKPNNPKVPFLWVSLRSEKKPGDFGRLIKIEIEKK
jgi:predicted metal-dependent peptidase